MGALISVIVPVYNVERYLPQCLESILGQEYEDLKVYLIDDGSTDGSGAICDDWAARDPRVKVIHQKNAGAAAAKNAGLRAASGEYLSFVDSDDYLEPGAYGYMLETLEQTGAEAGEFAFRDVYRDHGEDQVLFGERQMLTGREYLAEFTKGWTCALLWNKLYRRSLFEGVFFEEGHKIDDEYFTYQGFLNARTVVRDSRIVYNYRHRASSVMMSPAAREQRILDRVDALGKRREKVVQRIPELRPVFDTEYLDMLTYSMDYSDNTEKTLGILKKKLWNYLVTPGITPPPRRFLKNIARLLLTPTKTLLKNLPPEEEENVENCFP